MDDLTRNPAEQEPTPENDLRQWLNSHPGAQWPTESPPRTIRVMSPLGLGRLQGLPGDWSKYVLVSWGRLLKPEVTSHPAWPQTRWTAVFTTESPDGPRQHHIIYHRIHALFQGADAWIEAVRTPDGLFAITPRNFEQCQSEREGIAILRGWRLITFSSRGGGRKPGLTAHPHFPTLLIDKTQKLMGKEGENPGPTKTARELGISYDALNDWLNKNDLTWADVLLAANLASVRHAVNYLHGLQQGRRQQRI